MPPPRVTVAAAAPPPLPQALPAVAEGYDEALDDPRRRLATFAIAVIDVWRCGFRGASCIVVAGGIDIWRCAPDIMQRKECTGINGSPS
ncbi:unnamed protein product [Closterium sp. NIES-54]